MLAGVCAGLGRRFGLDPWPARLLFVLILLVIPGSQLLIYPILWLLMPDEGRVVAGPPAAPRCPGPPPPRARRLTRTGPALARATTGRPRLPQR